MQWSHDFARRLELFIEPFGTSKCFVDKDFSQAVGLLPGDQYGAHCIIISQANPYRGHSPLDAQQ